jgi:hypothetical protein
VNGAGTVVFLGPSLPLAEARSILPEARFRPPASQADVISSTRIDNPAVIALIDGTFSQTLSVWHKEILYARERGVTVAGASSMGALRAAECAPYGMVGVGAVYELFASGTLADDDEVAVAHAGADYGYRPLSEAMVNVRATVAAATASGVLSEGDACLVNDAAKALFFPDRMWPAIVAGARKTGLPDPAAGALEEFARASPVNVKADDARLLLRMLRDGTLPRAAAEPIPVARSPMFNALLERDRRVGRAGGEVSLEAIARHVLLHHRGAGELVETAMDRLAVEALAAFLRLEVTERELAEEEERFRVRWHLDADGVTRWCAENDVDEGELRRWVAAAALRRRVRGWLMVRRYRLGAVTPLLDELRRRGTYAEWAELAAEHETALAGSDDAGRGVPPIRELIAGHYRATGWLPETSVDLWASESGFEDRFDVAVELERARRARAANAAVDGGAGQ